MLIVRLTNSLRVSVWVRLSQNTGKFGDQRKAMQLSVGFSDQYDAQRRSASLHRPTHAAQTAMWSVLSRYRAGVCIGVSAWCQV